MMIQAQQMMSDLKKLGSITSSRDIQQLTYADVPGTHCPLMGAADGGSEEFRKQCFW